MTSDSENTGQSTFSHLGKTSETPTEYSPDLLESISRRVQREQIGLPDGRWPLFGVDVWHAHELTWLDGRGAPHIALLRLKIPCNSANIVESKSVKLYLQSFTANRFDSDREVRTTIGEDISQACAADVTVELLNVEHDFPSLPFNLDENLDRLTGAMSASRPESALLETDQDGIVADGCHRTNAFRCVCPVTGQPDFATIVVEYRGKPIVEEGLLTYLMSYRNHAGFHETTIEQIFVDIESACEPESLCLSGLFLRRGGIDISVFRSSTSEFDSHRRSPRQ